LILKSVKVGSAVASYRSVGSGKPVLYLHGFPTSSYLWRDVMQVVATNYEAIAVDFPGFGDSELLSDGHTWERLKAWVGDFVDALNIAPVHLAVHDWGGLIGLPWMCEQPEKVRSLFITDTSFSPKDRWHFLAQQWRAPDTGEESIGAIAHEGLEALLSSVTPGIERAAVDEYWKCLATQPHRAAKLEMYRSLEFEMFEPYMDIFHKTAGGRSRVVWGGNDFFVPPKVAERFGERLEAEVTVLKGVSHFPQEDAGTEVGRLHLEFLKGL